MIVQAIAFYVFAAVLIVSGILVVANRNPVYSVLFLILTFFNAAGLFVLLGAEFLAMILVVVYVGAVAVLFLFVVMMLDINFAELRQGFVRYAGIGAIVGIILVAEIIFVVSSGALGLPVDALKASPTPAGISNTQALGDILYTDYFYLFQAAGIVLLIAMIGAIVLTLRHKAYVKRQDINVQNARTPELAMTVRKVASGQGLLDSDAAEWVK